ncbi:uncharacterized protein SCHCODRAFT_01039218 [Schizophyllum commune H4-8]|uniref:uncharacterized protein n=1 Tax=Schizophyllum commune (strain H4-8 / FGSC 9210) TaxID=578458 RepID=UPI00215F833D|nr:uncharacterized protein SCHCODRAFT_01039218 [Schizophyllum commune H4-8]KAI5888369.1 hypothetical protein SCHCODRAFT_01039218 [Schizophyllum commune H4-8]
MLGSEAVIGYRVLDIRFQYSSATSAYTPAALPPHLPPVARSRSHSCTRHFRLRFSTLSTSLYKVLNIALACTSHIAMLSPSLSGLDNGFHVTSTHIAMAALAFYLAFPSSSRSVNQHCAVSSRQAPQHCPHRSVSLHRPTLASFRRVVCSKTLP